MLVMAHVLYDVSYNQIIQTPMNLVPKAIHVINKTELPQCCLIQYLMVYVIISSILNKYMNESSIMIASRLVDPLN